MGQYLGITGLILYSVFAPHSLAAAEISLAIAAIGWIVRSLATRKTGFRDTKLDVPLWLLFFWTLASALLSAEPRISIAKIQSLWVLLLFYLTQALVTRRTA